MPATMRIRPARPDDAARLAPLVARFRVELSALRGRERSEDHAAAHEELAGYAPPRFAVFVAEDGGATDLLGYLVCRIEDDVVWAESMYVEPAARRRGVAGALYAEAERLARARGSDQVYNWVHPDNDAIIAFLRRRGYDVLNLVEVRRPRPGERDLGEMRVGGHIFRY